MQLLLCAAVLSAIAYADSQPPVPQVTVPCKVVDVYDGDTVTVEVRMRVRVRLLDCWAPEVKGGEKAWGIQSKAVMARLADGKDAVLQVPLDGADRLDDVLTFGRVLGRISIDGKDVSRAMCDEGAAFATNSELRGWLDEQRRARTVD